MPHNCSVVLCKKGYRTVTIVGKQANVSYHNFSSEATAQKESSESMLLEEMSVRMPGKWTKICSLQDMLLDDRNQRFP